MNICIPVVLLMFAGLGSAPVALAQHHDHADQERAISTSNIGTVDFQTSCKPATKEAFDRGVALLHSFWFGQSRTAFEKTLDLDPDCAMAYWGIALTHWGNPFAGLRASASIDLGKTAIDKARTIGTPTARERAYIDAVSTLFADSNPGTQRQRVLDYEAAMQKTADSNPGDVEARIFAALAIAQAALPDDKTYERQLKAGALLEPLFEKMPKHPGLAHYIIHAYDVPSLAANALPAARAYADIAPDIPHALHMPSHTFTRVGLWRESVATNLRSARTAERNGEPGAVLHALDYMTYAYLQMAMDAQALESLEWMMRVVAAGAPGAAEFANSFPAVSIRARYALEREQWKDAAQLSVPVSAAPHVEATSRFARAVGAARSGNLAAVAPEIDRLAALRDRAHEMQDIYWAQIIDIQYRSAQAWLAFEQGNVEDGLALMRVAADAEDATEKSVVTPGPLAPAREMLGYMLLDANEPKEALAAFDKVIAKEPNRFLALYGAARAAEKARNPSRAHGYFRQIVSICNDTVSDRPELAYARKMAR